MSTPVNPFSKEYFEQEKAFYALPNYTDDNGVALRGWTVLPSFHGYLTRQAWAAEYSCPVLMLKDPLANGVGGDGSGDGKGRFIASLSPQMLQAQFVPIQRAKGRVLTLGLGMGYFLLRTAAKKEVSEVVVIEVEPRIIEFFQKAFAGRKELSKIRIVRGSAYDLENSLSADTLGEPLQPGFDFGFVDIYSQLYSTASVRDVRYFIDGYQISRYHFLGLERIFLESIGAPYFRDTSFSGRDSLETVPSLLYRFLRLWQQDKRAAPSQLILKDSLLDLFQRETWPLIREGLIADGAENEDLCF